MPRPRAKAVPLLSAHMSIAGGLHKAVEAAVALGCPTMQIFTKNTNQWAARPFSDDEVRTFHQAVKAAGLVQLAAHDSYLINLAAPDDALYRKSIAAFADEMERAETLGLDYLVMHPGAHTGSGVEAGIVRVVAALDDCLGRCAGYKVMVLVETTAGQGTCLGAAFEEIAAIRDRVREPERIGFCLDTCHVFAAGYPLGKKNEYTATFQQFDDICGLSHIRVFHINDSAKPLGSRVDRHAAIGRGEIGMDAFRCLITDPRFEDRPKILETPKEDDDGNPMDPVNLAVLRGFLKRR